MNYLIQGGYVVFPKDDTTIISQQDIYVKDGIIHYEKPFEIADKIINASNKIIMPALTNAHHHIYSTLSKGVPCEVPFQDFMGNLKNLWWTLDHSLQKDDMILSTAIAMKDAISHGVTTVFDHHISGYTENALSDMAEVFAAYKVSGTLAFELSDRNGVEFFEKSLAENIRFAKAQQGKDIQGMIGLHASFTLSEKSLEQIAKNTADFPIHVHVAEGEIDGIQCQEEYGMGLIERFDKHGLLRDNSLLIHCSNLTSTDLDILKKRNVFLAQAVDSNMNNGLNVGNIHDFVEADLKVTVGTDGMHSSPLKAMKNSMIFTKYLNKNCDLGYPEMNALFLNNFKIKQSLGLPLGVNQGEKADLAIFDYQPATPFDTDQFLGHLIFGLSESRCQFVLKDDELLLDDYHVTKDLYPDYFARAKEISSQMFQRFEANKGTY